MLVHIGLYGGDPPLAPALDSDGFWRLVDAKYHPVAGIIASQLGAVCTIKDEAGNVIRRCVYYTDRTGSRYRADLPIAAGVTA